MSKIKKISIKNYLGIKELGIDTNKINIFKGPKGSGKSSFIEALEKAFTNKSRRTEIIKHGEEEATIYVELDDGLEVDRKIRTGKADYLKIRKGDEGVPSTETFLRKFINGEIFRPIDWVNKTAAEQTKSILNMLEINWSNEDILKWFGEIPSNVDFNQHILMVLKAIEVKYYKDREEVNRQIKELKTQMSVIKKDMPVDYDGDFWREKKVQEYYSKVSEAQTINQLIEQAKSLKEGFETKLEAIKSSAESDKLRVAAKYKEQRQDASDIIDLCYGKVEKAKDIISRADETKKLEMDKLDNQLENEYQILVEKYRTLKYEKAEEIDAKVQEQYDITHAQRDKVIQKNEELNGLDSLENKELEAADVKAESEIEKEKIRVGKATDYLENNTPADILPLQEEADKVATMQSYLRDWDRFIDIRDNQLSMKETEAKDLTAKIETARTMPGNLLKTAQMPIEGISVDENGNIRIDGTLIDGLSDGEKLELAMKIAKAQAGDLKVICLDRFESLKSEQKKILETALTDDFQYFITEHTDDTEMKIEKLGGNN